MKKQKKNPAAAEKEKNELPGNPVYGPAEDIYSNTQRSPLKRDETTSINKGLDVPGSELDDADEKIGEEDEENNYYSLGGDRHDDLEEDKE
jgi:hypothetical protein